MHDGVDAGQHRDRQRAYVAEVLRAIDSLQLTEREKVATPVNWSPGEPVIIAPSLSADDARERFPQGWEEPRPYLRIVDLQA